LGVEDIVVPLFPLDRLDFVSEAAPNGGNASASVALLLSASTAASIPLPFLSVPVFLVVVEEPPNGGKSSTLDGGGGGCGVSAGIGVCEEEERGLLRCCWT